MLVSSDEDSVVVSVVVSTVEVATAVVSVLLIFAGTAKLLHAAAASMLTSMIMQMILFIPVPDLFFTILLLLSAQITVNLKKFTRTNSLRKHFRKVYGGSVRKQKCCRII